MAVVEYKVPQSVGEAVEMLTDKTARVLAGGTDLIIQLRAQNSDPVIAVDIKKIDSMMTATMDGNGLTLGPSMSCAELTAREDIKAEFPGLVEAAYLIGSTQVQGRCSVGGNLCNSSPAADTIPALSANAAQCVIQGPDGERTVAVEDFVTGVGTNCMATGELLTAIKIAIPAAGTADAYLRFIPRSEMDIAVAGAGVSVTLDADGKCTAARVSIGAVATTALLVTAAADALIGTSIDDAALQAAADAASEASKPISDRRGTAEFRRHVVGVLTRRAAKIAADRAKEK
ncbi:MAG: xanthine dehydrogenase family protein subunit M [bacterium]|nr:xanthine dehydrogenase family protein subunit M [Gammaproteobacteria bacterium]HIL96758.1 xanthine dehydrogenase family protein subunit M [Pseudomonadales bacterium]